MIELTVDGRHPETGLIIDRRLNERYRRANFSPAKQDDEKRKRREYYHRNKEKMSAAQFRWVSENKDHVRGYMRKYVSMKVRTDPQYKIATYLQIRLSTGINHIRSGYFPEQRKQFIGCTWREMKGHIERQFEPGMLWANYGDRWQIDHIVPKSEFNLLEKDEQLRCFYYTNLRPRWVEDNCGKVGQKKRDRATELDPIPTEALIAEMNNPTNSCSGRMAAHYSGVSKPTR
jgi:hypothetical protein